ncbi:MAG: DUF433 domain-containing protein [Planctomycetes bacterium]|nr:DUF433 domain-containing protein [Planctomycetota bacterium]
MDPTLSPSSLPPVRPEDLEGDLVQPGDPLFGIIWVNPERVHGAPCFFGTRVPLSCLFDALRAGESVEFFLEGFPNINRPQVDAVLELAGQGRLGVRGRAA